MAAECLFCDNLSGSKEHLWAAWIHRQKNFGPLRITVGKSPETIDDDPEQTINTVCRKCNNGWMSVLEQRNRSLIGCLLRDIAAPLNFEQQTFLAAWAVKTAMVLDSVKNLESNPLFYEKTECIQMRLDHTIPARTRIWIGRSSLSSLGAYGTDVAIVSPELRKLGMGMATTIVVGHLAVQVFGMHIYAEHVAKNVEDVQPKPGNWANMLVPIWPIGPHSVMWPPQVTFTNSGQHSIARLMDRWRIGKAV